MMQTAEKYNARLTAGLGLLSETRQLLDLWSPGMKPPALLKAAMNVGTFPGMSARTLKNIVSDAFAGRYLSRNGQPATLLKQLHERGLSGPLTQMCFVYTCRLNRILADFVNHVYWSAYSAGHKKISNEEAREFITSAIADGMTATAWTDTITRRVSSYLTGCLADFGLLESGSRRIRTILPYRIQSQTSAILAYQLHFEGLPDNKVIAHESWSWFGMERADVTFELQRWAKKNLLLIQTAGDVTRIDWTLSSMDEVLDVIA